MGPLLRGVCMLLLAGLVPSAACADLVTYNFSGTITSVTDTSSPVGNVGGVTVGDSFFGTLTYESSGAAGDLNGSPNIGAYLSAATGGQVSVTINGLTFSGGVRSYTVRDQLPTEVSPMGDDFSIVAGSNFDAPPGWTGTGQALDAYFADTTGAAFANDAFPDAAALFDYGEISLRFGTTSFPGGTDSSVEIVGTMNLQGVPEPSSFLLGGVALGLGVFRRRRIGAKRRLRMRPPEAVRGLWDEITTRGGQAGA